MSSGRRGGWRPTAGLPDPARLTRKLFRWAEDEGPELDELEWAYLRLYSRIAWAVGRLRRQGRTRAQAEGEVAQGVMRVLRRLGHPRADNVNGRFVRKVYDAFRLSRSQRHRVGDDEIERRLDALGALPRTRREG